MLMAAVPALWSAVHGWFTPTVLFLLLNLVIGTIAVASRSMSSSAPGDGDHRGALLRAPSFALDRLRSFSFSRLPAHDDPAPARQVFDKATEPPLPPPAELGRERSHEHEQAHIERIRSEAAVRWDAPAPLMRKSASERSPFAHFAPAAEDNNEVVEAEARRPAKTREAVGGGAHDMAGASDGDEEEPQTPVEAEVDERADYFIRRFREHLRLQRLDSILRYRDMLRRGHHAASSG